MVIKRGLIRPSGTVSHSLPEREKAPEFLPPPALQAWETGPEGRMRAFSSYSAFTFT